MISRSPIISRTLRTLPTAEAYAYAGAVMVDNMLNCDTDEGITAFLEKRDPAWKI